ncbi:MAG: glycosyltransferase family 2 protein [Crocinitomicaceae bacterium]
MKISLITVSFNAADTIKDTIDSVLSQKGVDLEYIIIDGGSTDETVAIVKSYGDQISTFVSAPDKGIYDGMNKGIALASGDVIGILNADDMYADEQVLQEVISCFTPETEVLYGDLVYVDQNNTNKVKRTWIAKPYKKNAFLKGWMPPHPTFFVRKEIYEKYGAYTLQLKSAADYELMLRVIHKQSVTPVYLNKILVKMRLGGASNASLKNRLRANREDKKAWEMNQLKPLKTTFIRKPISKIGQFFKK